MKKLLGILILGLFLSGNAYAKNYSNYFFSFNNWLLDNGHDQYLTKGGKKFDICKEFKGKSKEWFNAKCENMPKGRFLLKNNLNINTYKGRWSIPFQKSPNKDTLIYYNYKNLFSHDTNDSGTLQWDKYSIPPSKNPYQFKLNLVEDKYIKKQMQKKPILSYLYFNDEQIIIDELTPKNRFGEFVNNETKLRSNSVGKTMISYVLGHAICEGYIDGVNSKISDWPLLQNTLYQDQKLIDLLNMAAGDQKYVFDSVILKNGQNKQSVNAEADTKDIYHYMKIIFDNSKKSKPKYNYNIINTNLIFNYVLFKTEEDFQKILNKTFQEKSKIKNSVYFFRVPRTSPEYGDANSMFFATRYDYLRIAKAMLDDWQNDTCVGKYLKTIYKNRIKKNLPNRSKFRVEEATTSYGGQFHLDIIGMKDRKILGMGGYGGQQILIDVENSKIIVLHSIHLNRKTHNYNWNRIVYNKLKN